MSDKYFTIQGTPVAKPRMTQQDKWMKRPRVLRYRAWAQVAQLSAGRLPPEPMNLFIVAFLPMPQSWSKKRQVEMEGKPHRSKPDISNILKAAEDALFPESDAMIYSVQAMKVWAYAKDARMEVAVR